MQQRLSLRWPVTWALFALSGVFAALGVVFVMWPVRGADMFGVSDPSGTHPYVRAVGLRDIALAAYLSLQALFASARAVMILLVATLVIPAGDVALLTAEGAAQPSRMMLHLASGCLFAGAAAWCIGR